MKIWAIRKGQTLVATLSAAQCEQGGLHGKSPYVWVIRDEKGNVIGTLYLGTNCSLSEYVDDKSS